MFFDVYKRLPKPLSYGFGEWKIITQKSRIGGYNIYFVCALFAAIITQKSRVGGYSIAIYKTKISSKLILNFFILTDSSR